MYGRSAETGYVGHPEITDLERRSSDLIKPGRVVQADYTKQPYVVKVGVGDPDDADNYFITGWLPVQAGRSDEWNPLQTGEAVTILSEAGEIQNGVVMTGALHNTDNPSPGDRGDLYRKKFSDGSVIEYDIGAGGMKLTAATAFRAEVGGASIVITGGQIILSAGGETLTIGGGKMTSSGPIKGDGGLDITGGTFTHNGVFVGDEHTHTAVMAGPSLTGPPPGG